MRLWVLALLLGLAGALADHSGTGLVPSGTFIAKDASGSKTLEAPGIALDGEPLGPPSSYKEVEQCAAACRDSPHCDYFMHCDSSVRLWQPAPPPCPAAELRLTRLCVHHCRRAA